MKFLEVGSPSAAAPERGRIAAVIALGKISTPIRPQTQATDSIDLEAGRKMWIVPTQHRNW